MKFLRSLLEQYRSDYNPSDVLSKRLRKNFII